MAFCMAEVLEEAGLPVDINRAIYSLEHVYNFHFTELEKTKYKELRGLSTRFLPVVECTSVHAVLLAMLKTLTIELRLRDDNEGQLELNKSTIAGLIQLVDWRRRMKPRKSQQEFEELISTLARVSLMTSFVKDEAHVLPILISSLARLR